MKEYTSGDVTNVGTRFLEGLKSWGGGRLGVKTLSSYNT